MSTATPFASETANLMRSIIQRIATGPELSKDISFEEARVGMRAILDGEIDPVQAGIFLIALRMKRETDDENLGVFEAIREVTTVATAEADEVIDVADPYDGYTRSLPPSPFLPALLAECGVAAVSHGVGLPNAASRQCRTAWSGWARSTASRITRSCARRACRWTFRRMRPQPGSATAGSAGPTWTSASAVRA